MQYYIRYNSRVMGPFDERIIIDMFEKGSIDSSVQISINHDHWSPPEEFPVFSSYALRHPHQQMNNSSSPIFMSRASQRCSNKKDFSVFFFMIFCLLVVAGTIFALYLLNKDDNTPVLGDSSSNSFILANSDGLSLSYDKYKKAVGLVTITFQDKDGVQETVPIGTAFAISPNRFVTNAHVAYGVKNGFEDMLVQPLLDALILEEAQERGRDPEAYLTQIGERGYEQRRTNLLSKLKDFGLKVRDIEIRLNHSNGRSFTVEKVQVHPRYNPAGDVTGEYDVAVFEIDGKTDSYFDIATKKELSSIRAGIPVASAGFPLEGIAAHTTNLDKPEASYASGDIKQITDFDNKDGGMENNRSITHSIPISGGTSGSPIFIANGKVIAVLWGGDLLMTERGRISSGSLNNKAVRIDQIESVGKPIPWEQWINDPVQSN